MEPDASSILANGPRPFADALPVCIYDCYNTWSSLRIDVSPSLGRFEWQWALNGNVVNDSSSSARLLFHIVQTANIYHPATSSAYWHLNPYAHVFLIPVNLIGHPEHCNRVRQFVQSCRDLSCQFLIICTAKGNELRSFKKSFDQLANEIAILSSVPDKLVTLSTKSIPREPEAPPSCESEAYSTFLSYITELVHASVQHRLNSYEQQGLHLWKTRTTSNWTFARFFAVKESLAFVFCHLGRRDLSVKQYESLHTLLMSTDYKRNPEIPFSDLSPAEAAQGICDPGCRDYRVKLLDGSISELDLHIFVFACQLTLLEHDRKYTQIAEKAVKLLFYVNRRCSEFQRSPKVPLYPAIFRDIWTFTACRLISTTLAPAIPKPIASNEASQFCSSRERHTVRLLAGFHVHALRALQALAKITLPGCLSPETEGVDDRDALLKEVLSSSSDKLRSALSSCSVAESLHSELANAAASLYEMGYRSRGAAALDADAGRVHLRNGSYAEAESLLSAQCSAFANNFGWDVLHRRERTDLANAEKQLGRAQDYLLSCLTMLCMCRTSRLLDKPSMLSHDDLQQLREDAMFWFREITTTAKLLSRAMKYKAERLFFVTVLPNMVSWEEGSAGSITVRIKSDIPVPLLVDCVSAECKCARTLSIRKSALSQPQNQASSDDGSAIPHSGHGMSGRAPPFTPDGPSSETIVLKSNLKIIVAPGTNDIPVYTNEVPHHGLYWISNVTLYLGELKIVHVGPKPTMNTITSSQVGVSKQAVSNSISSPLVDFAIFRVHNPFITASKRAPSAILNIESTQTYYILPRVRQQILFNISAFERGIASGSILKCHLTKLAASGASDSLFPKEGCLALNLMNQHAESVDFNIQGCKDNIFDALEANIVKDVHNGDTLTGHVSFDVVDFSLGNDQIQISTDPLTDNCHLRIALTWSELEGSMDRRFHCDVDSRVLFIHPLEIEGFVKFNLTHAAESHQHNDAKQSDPLENRSGTVLLFIRSHVRNEKELQISSINLKLLSLSENGYDDDSSPDALLPCTLRRSSIFVCSFTFPSKQLQRNKRCLSGETTADLSNQHLAATDIAGTAAGVLGTPVILKVAEDFLSNQKSPAGLLPAAASPHNLADSHGTSKKSPLKGNTSETVSSGRDIGGERDAPLKRSEEVRDSGKREQMPLDVPNKYMAPPEVERFSIESGYASEYGSSHLGTLKVQLGISETGKAVYERRIEVGSVGPVNQLIVERKLNCIVEVGKVTNMSIRVFNHNTFQNGVELINFELDVNPSVWLVIGRRGGKIRVTEEDSMDGREVWNVELMTTKCGTHAAPKVNLFTKDGCKLSWDYDDVSRNMNVVALPNVSVVGGCSGGEVCLTKEQVGISEGIGLAHKWMPVVVESDSFFSRG